MSESQLGRIDRPQHNPVLILIPGFALTAVLTAIAIHVGDMPGFINMGLMTDKTAPESGQISPTLSPDGAGTKMLHRSDRKTG
ncbi:hypothetical protein [Xenorhabdus bovienii]|uniref:hypothetical protein n=1 Tax=Xenorhabdus bovienii TaxID=40576 RepID=UPI0023B2FDFA|nr:hypothetical protein [Xenorhabdus bovienii]MDE9483181.1 hypothetical protein [Xenorhabdus bovienii]